MSEPLTKSDERAEEYLLLLSQDERWLSAYVYSLVNSDPEAEDILQDCRLVMWRQFDSFTRGSNFRAWARQIVLYHVLNYRRTKARRPLVELDEDFIEVVAAEIERVGDQLDLKAEALHHCLRRLPCGHRELIVRRYYEDLSIGEISKLTGQSINAVYRLLSRVRRILSDCVSRHARLGTTS